VHGVDEVLIAGCGAAGCFAALRALQQGLRPTLLRVAVPAVGGIEIIPASTAPLLETLALGDIIAALGPGFGNGLRRRQLDGTSDTMSGRSLHIDRLKLRETLLAEAVRRGAQVRDVDRLPPLDPAVYSVDASGQRAVWSRPVVRRGRRSADIFVGETAITPGTGRLAFLSHGWAYLASDQNQATIGVVGRHARAPTTLDAETRGALSLPPTTSFRFVGRRPAFVQWAVAPVVGCRLAIGDAALLHDPLGGRGLAFALGSAFAAVAVLATWRDDPSAIDAARSYYENYIASEIRRHLAFLDGDLEPVPVPAELPEYLRWIAPASAGLLAIDSRVVAGEVFTLASGQSVRWVGGLDLAKLQDLIIEVQTSAEVADRLCAQGLTKNEARLILLWTLSQNLVRSGEIPNL
jgi:hypothetical protein